MPKPFVPASLGKRLADARRKLGVREGRDVGVPEVAAAVGVSAQSVYYWEADEKSPREDVLAKLAAFLRVTPAYLRYGVGKVRVPDALDDPTIGAVPLTEAQKQRALRAAAKTHAPPATKSGTGGRRPKR